MEEVEVPLKLAKVVEHDALAAITDDLKSAKKDCDFYRVMQRNWDVCQVGVHHVTPWPWRAMFLIGLRID